MTDTIKRLRELHEKASPGEWTQIQGSLDFKNDTAYGFATIGPGLNAELIVTLRNALPALLAVVEAAKEANRLLNEWELIRRHSYVHEKLQDALAALKGESE